MIIHTINVKPNRFRGAKLLEILLKTKYKRLKKRKKKKKKLFYADISKNIHTFVLIYKDNGSNIYSRIV